MGTAVLKIMHDDVDVSIFIPTSYMIAYNIKAHCSSRNYSIPCSSSTKYYKEVDEILIFFSLWVICFFTVL